MGGGRSRQSFLSQLVLRAKILNADFQRRVSDAVAMRAAPSIIQASPLPPKLSRLARRTDWLYRLADPAEWRGNSPRQTKFSRIHRPWRAL
jgi:hypothetical protein